MGGVKEGIREDRVVVDEEEKDMGVIEAELVKADALL